MSEENIEQNPTDPTEGQEEDLLDLRTIVIRMVVGIIVIVIVVGAAAYLLRQPIMDASKGFVSAFGGWGVAAGFFLVDGFTLPFPNDAFSLLGLKGNISFWMVVFWASLGSYVGGLVGYGIGVMLRRTAWFIRFMNGRGAEVYALIRRYGLVALAIAALTPIPYSIACWASGAVQIRMSHFLLVSLLRIPRIAFYLWLIELGFITFT